MPEFSADSKARISLRAALESLILVLRRDPLDWAAASVLLRDVDHRYAETDLAPPAHVLDPLRAHLTAHEPFDREAAIGELQAAQDAV